jgi:tetratricopeptide (TPR) repeat protein
MALALAFTVLLNVWVLSVALWPAWLEPRLKFACGVGAGLLWFAALVETRGELRRVAERRAADESEEQPLASQRNPNDDLLKEAQHAYLRADYVAAERALRRALARDPRDVEALLWHATLLRRTGRLHRAERRLRRLERLDDARGWSFEVAAEWRRLRSLATPAATAGPPGTSPRAEQQGTITDRDDQHDTTPAIAGRIGPGAPQTRRSAA